MARPPRGEVILSRCRSSVAVGPTCEHKTAPRDLRSGNHLQSWTLDSRHRTIPARGYPSEKREAMSDRAESIRVAGTGMSLGPSVQIRAASIVRSG